MMMNNGQIINVQAYKHNGLLYRQWNGVKVLEVSPYMFVLFMYKTKVMEKSGQKWIVREPILWWFPKDSFFNTTGLIRASGTYFYTNIASPPIFEDGTLKFIDYDLDVKAYPRQKIKLVDKNEYEINKNKYNYPLCYQKKIEETIDEVFNKIKCSDGFFREDVVETYLHELIDAKLLPKKFAKNNIEKL